jgi:DNA-binding PadR family transcriptional regulator
MKGDCQAPAVRADGVARYIEPIHRPNRSVILISVLELAILGLLKERPMHGYDLRKRLREEFRLLANLSFGSVYPALGRLEGVGAVRALPGPHVEAGGRSLGRSLRGAGGSAMSRVIPLTGSLSGERAAYRARPGAAAAEASERRGQRGTRSRKVYEITESGNALFEQLLGDSSDRAEDTKTFALKLVFARHLSPEARLRLFERRRAHLLDDLARSRKTMSVSNERPLDPYERSLVEHASAATESDISWLDRLIEAERGAPLTVPTSHSVNADPRRDQ